METICMPDSEILLSAAPTALSDSTLFTPWWGFALYPSPEGNSGAMPCIDDGKPWSEPLAARRQFEIAAHLNPWSAPGTAPGASTNWIECESAETAPEGREMPICSANGKDFLDIPAQVLMQDHAVQRETDPATDSSPAVVEAGSGADSITQRIGGTLDSVAPPKTGFVTSWTVQAATSILFGGTNRIVSPWLETCFPSAPFKLTIHALAQAGGKRSFRDAKGQGTVEVKCDTVLSHPVSFLLSLCGDLATEESLGPFTHDFGNSSVWRMPDELPAWDLRLVAKETFSVCLEILPC
jgi:hypothetical protein